MQNLRRVGKNYCQIWSRLRTEVHVVLRGYWRLLVVCNVLDRLYVSFWRHRPLNLTLSYEVGPKRWFFGPRFVGGMDTPDFGHAFSNYTYFRSCSRIWFSSVQRAQRVADKKRRRKCGNYSDVLPLKAARRDSISNLTSFGASNLSCRWTQCRFI